MDHEDDRLDARLDAAIRRPALSPAFRRTLQARLPRRRAFAWPDFLPDLAHLAGCGAAMVLLAWALPGHTSQVVGGGSGFTLITYFLQAVLRNSVEGES